MLLKIRTFILMLSFQIINLILWFKNIYLKLVAIKVVAIKKIEIFDIL